MKILENNEPLKAIVCGFEHSGTTLVSEILRQHPRLDSGFEGGFLFCENVQDFLGAEPFYSHAKAGWGVSDEDLKYITAADNWPEVYRRLRERAEVIKDKTSWLFDKTPVYMGYLPQILEKVPDVPCIVIVKDLRAFFWSYFKRTQLSMDEWYNNKFEDPCNHVLFYARGWQQAIEKGYSKRLLLIKYENLCLNPPGEVKKIFDFLDLDFHEKYLCFPNSRYANVRGTQIYIQYLVDYLDHLPSYACDKVLELVDQHPIMKDWLFEFT